jgi:hypothetical protein
MLPGHPSRQSQPFAFDGHVNIADKDIHAIDGGHDPARFIAVGCFKHVEIVCAKMIAEHHPQDDLIFRNKHSG